MKMVDLGGGMYLHFTTKLHNVGINDGADRIGSAAGQSVDGAF